MTRTSSCVAASETAVFSVEGDVFNLVVGDLLRDHERAKVELIYETKIFSMWSANYIAQLSRLMAERVARCDDCLYSQGERVASIFILVEGEVLIFQRASGNEKVKAFEESRSKPERKLHLVVSGLT